MPLNRWMLPIQPNSILAALTTVSKTSLLVPVTACIGQLKWRHFILQPRPLDQLQQFDNASRGPWGSAILIYSFVFQVRSLVVLTLAAATLLALGIESSAQQIISFELREVKVANGSVLTTRAEAYYSRTWNTFTYDDRIYYEKSYPGLANYNEGDRSRQILKLKAATYSAFTGSPQKPYYTCPEPAKRCQWDDFSTLGICGKTRNVTDLVVIQNCSSIGFSSRCDLWHPFDDRKFANGSKNSNPKNGAPISLEYTSGVSTYSFTVFSSAKLSTTASLGSIWTVKVSNASDFDGFHFRPLESFGSYTSDLYWCDRKLNNATASTMGLEVDSVQSTPWAGLDGSAGIGSSNFFDFLRQGRNGTEFMNSPSFPQRGYGYEYVFNTQSEPTYNISVPMINSIRDVVDSITGAGLIWAGDQFFHGIADSPSTIDYELSGYMLTHDIDTIIQNVADGLTAFMLEPNGDNVMAEAVSGYMIYGETRIHVRWVWLLLPALEALIACCLLALTTIVTNGQPLVKNSAIALLAYGLSNFDREELLEKTEVVTEERLEKRAERMMARLEKDGPESYRFTKYL
ncbi:hypothetical protein NUW58_g3641 [Xylaria curta]|uniref:Uncharacterized protein n=1 Tax=Xylaria curta TaxID=42375 RepID=A0ACC1PA11_9PEZI|nr:hypothetical protein NUW58_g3641 [Xylaria curta]